MLLHLLLAATLLAGGCNDTGEPAKPSQEAQITCNPEAVTLSHEAATATMDVTADSDWAIFSSEDWCKLSPSGGIAGTTKVTLNVTENKTNAVRTAQITIKSGRTYKFIDVKQNYNIVGVSVEDEALLAALLTQYDADSDGVLSTVEAEAISEVVAPACGITTLAGLEQFGGITRIVCNDNNIASIDLSHFPRLTELNCAGNKLTELNIRLNNSLTQLDCTANPLARLLVWTGFKVPEGYKLPDGVEIVEPEIPTPAGYRLVWQDEFNTAGRSLPDNSKWWYETGGGGWGNNEKQTYVSGREGTDTVALVSNGVLKITAKKVGDKVLSVRMNTNEGWTYGYFEASLKLPVGKGTWPAFWMMPKNFRSWPDDGEIDIMEHVGYHPNYVSSSIHCKAYYHKIGTQKTHELYLATAQKEFHTYACEWTEDYLKFYFDGELHFTFENDHKGNYDTWPFFNPFYLKLNLAWGGDWGGAMGLDESCLPATYEIDYVRVFKRAE